ncbi:hypothetical protein [Pseudomonas amygdali]|uniref:hypothetical protein n=1 Tax=Pseudomonas amygdali TaxID=47877 RepID=UPI001FB823E8|nr:hypothetical protein [Pseudomonas amygdali]UPT35711.1 hypothetical protein LT107_20135 [Pseudomonas amygdali pv. loropetali]
MSSNRTLGGLKQEADQSLMLKGRVMENSNPAGSGHPNRREHWRGRTSTPVITQLRRPLSIDAIGTSGSE